MNGAEFPAALEVAKQASTFQLLFRCSRRVNELAISRIRERYHLPGLRPAHTALFPHIDLEGTRLTELARRVGVSKQAVGQLVDELEEMGALERIPDLSDGRARRICFKGDGLLAGLALLGELEQELEEAVGPELMLGLRQGLIALMVELDAPGGSP